MSQLTVFKKCVQIRYKSSKFSKAFLLHLVLWLINIVYPWLFVYHSDGVWRKVETFMEQPMIRFNYKIATLLSLTNTTVPGNRIVWSSCVRCNNLIDHRMIRVPSITNCENDHEMDGKYDQFEMIIKFPIEKNEQVRNVQIFLFFDYSLQNRIKFNMESLIHLSYSNHISSSRLSIFGDVNLYQKAMLTNGLNQMSILEEDENLLKLEEILKKSQKNAVSTILGGNSFSLWTENELDDGENFEVKIHLNYVENLIQYRPSHWFMYKWAWIQYFSVFVIFYWLTKRMRCFIMENNLVETIKFDENQCSNIKH